VFEGGIYPVIETAVHRLESNPDLIQLLGGLPLTVYGSAGSRGSRRRPVVNNGFLEDGRKMMETNFWVEGGAGVKGQVYLQVVEVIDHNFIKVFLDNVGRKWTLD